MSQKAAGADELDATYTRLHTVKEDAFWTARMGLGPDAAESQTALDVSDAELQRFLRDPGRLARTRELLAAATSDEERVRLQGWVAMFEAHTIADDAARALAEELALDEGRLELARGEMQLGYDDPEQGFVRAGVNKLRSLLWTAASEPRRRAAWQGLRSIETFVLQHGFLEIVKKRNRLGRMLGAEDYYDWKTRRVEGMSKRELFELLDDLELLTRESGQRAIEQTRRRHGDDGLTPWNIIFVNFGDLTAELDPYFPFRSAIERWGRSFAALGVRFAGAELVLDLLDRPGKYENGFMHGPVIAWRRAGVRIPARIHFTANALPGTVGSGEVALKTLFHEGGHAAHFANIDMPSSCFGQEFAPTSAAFCETQSMFLDSLLGDEGWQSRHALDGSGRPLPLELMERSIELGQPFSAWVLRSMLAICQAERAIYELEEHELTPEKVLATLRDVERRFYFLEEGGTRPSLSVPHLLSGEFSAYFHSYVLARMAVSQARDYFYDRDGHVADNPRIGPELARVWWQPGNSLRLREFVPRLGGKPLSAAHLARDVNLTVEQAKERARQRIERMKDVAAPPAAIELDARVRVVHGPELVAELDGDFEKFSNTFAAWIDVR